MKAQTAVQRGFTLIELIVVIAIIGVLAAVAIPKFTSLNDAAREANIKGYAGALASASATNYAAKVAGSTYAVVNSCDNLSTNQGSLVTATTEAVTTTGATTAAAGTTFTCTLSTTATPVITTPVTIISSGT